MRRGRPQAVVIFDGMCRVLTVQFERLYLLIYSIYVSILRAKYVLFGGRRTINNTILATIYNSGRAPKACSALFTNQLLNSERFFDYICRMHGMGTE